MESNNPPGIPARPSGTTEGTDGMLTTNDANCGLAVPPLSTMPPDFWNFSFDDTRGISSFLHFDENINDCLGVDFFTDTELDANSSRGNTEVPMSPRRNFETGGSSTAAPGKVDGSFLTLRTGDDMECSRSNNFVSTETSSKLEETASAQPNSSHAVQRATNLWSLDGASNNATRVQTGPGGFANLARSSASANNPWILPGAPNTATRVQTGPSGFANLASSSANNPRILAGAQSGLSGFANMASNNPWSLAGAANNATRVQTSIGGFSNSANSHSIPNQESASAQLNSFPARQNLNNTLSVAGASRNATRIQTSAGALPGSANNLISRIPTSDRGAVITDNAELHSFEFHSLQTPASDSSRLDHMPLSMPLGNTSVPYPGHSISPGLPLQQFRPSQFTTSQSLLALQQARPSQFTTSQSFLAPQQVRPSQFSTNRSLLPSQHGRPSNIATSPSDFYQQQNLYGQHGRSSANAFPNSVYGMHGVIPIPHPGLRNPTPPAEGTRHYSVPRSIQPVGQLYSRHNAGSAVPVTEPCGANPLTTRLGVQSNDFTTAQRTRGPAPFSMAAQVNPPRPFPATGPAPFGMAAQVNPPRPFPATVNVGQLVPGIAAPVPTGPRPRVDYSRGQVNRSEKLNIGPQPSPKLYHQPTKRLATETPQYATSSQRRRISSQPVTNPHQSQSNRVPGPATARIPAATPVHIKGPGSEEELPPLTGHKCDLCHMDLKFTAEGQVYQPVQPGMLQTTGVLPCGHTFHVECLEKITPPDQAADPPCIPCALHEK